MRMRVPFDGLLSSCSVDMSIVLVSVLAVGVCLGEQKPASAPPPSRPRPAPAAARLKTIQLPEPAQGGAMSFEQALVGQLRLEVPGNQRLEFPKIGQLAWAAQGVNTRPAATAGGAPALTEASAIKVYFVLPDGLYLYEPVTHALQQTADGDLRAALASALFKQPAAPVGGCHVILASSAREVAARGATRSRTALLLQAGRVSQNIQLEAVTQGLTYVSTDEVDANVVRRVTRLGRNVEPLYVAIVGYPASQTPQTTTAVAPGTQTAKAALLVIPATGIQDEEFMGTRRALELAGVQVTVASSRSGPLTGMLGGTTQADLLLNQVSVDNFNAVIFIGGLGAAEYFNNPVAQNLARQAFVRHKVLAAIGTAPTILANAGVLRGARATAYLSEQVRLTQGGAAYTGNAVEKDGLIVTATGPLAVALFVQAILEGLGETG
jgi:protease I